MKKTMKQFLLMSTMLVLGATSAMAKGTGDTTSSRCETSSVKSGYVEKESVPVQSAPAKKSEAGSAVEEKAPPKK